jgi:hypothetical protein
VAAAVWLPFSLCVCFAFGAEIGRQGRGGGRGMCHLSGKRIFLKPRTRQWIGAPSLVRSTRRPCGARACAVALASASPPRPLLALRSALSLTDSSHSRSHLNVSSASLLDGRMRMRMRSMLGSPRTSLACFISFMHKSTGIHRSSCRCIDQPFSLVLVRPTVPTCQALNPKKKIKKIATVKFDTEMFS